jgi:predicted nucleotidyltransferase
MDENNFYKVMFGLNCANSLNGICYNQSMEKVKVKVPKAKIAEFCKRWNVSELAIFGSALRADFRPDSDVDILVSFAPEAEVSLFDMVHMQDELKEIFGRDVDLISKRGVENSRNYLRRKAILESAQVIHVAR